MDSRRVSKNFRGLVLTCVSLGVLSLPGCSSAPGATLAFAADALTAADGAGSLDGMAGSDAAAGGNDLGAMDPRPDGAPTADGAIDAGAPADTGAAIDAAKTDTGSNDAGPTDTGPTDTGSASEWPTLAPGVDPACPSASKWTKGTQGSKSMEPGMACINCHDNGEGPGFFAAGTVFRSLVAIDKCNGTKSITVELTGADGKVYTTTTNSAGNFYFNQNIATPYTARVISGQLSRKMFAEQTDGDCNGCHTAKGANGAPGRIVEPSL